LITLFRATLKITGRPASAQCHERFPTGRQSSGLWIRFNLFPPGCQENPGLRAAARPGGQRTGNCGFPAEKQQFFSFLSGRRLFS
jgi:hypothetical protein